MVPGSKVSQVQRMRKFYLCLREEVHSLLARISLLQTQTHMVDSPYLSDLLMNAFRNWSVFSTSFYTNINLKIFLMHIICCCYTYAS